MTTDTSELHGLFSLSRLRAEALLEDADYWRKQPEDRTVEPMHTVNLTLTAPAMVERCERLAAQEEAAYERYKKAYDEAKEAEKES